MSLCTDTHLIGSFSRKIFGLIIINYRLSRVINQSLKGSGEESCRKMRYWLEALEVLYERKNHIFIPFTQNFLNSSDLCDTVGGQNISDFESHKHVKVKKFTTCLQSFVDFFSLWWSRRTGIAKNVYLPRAPLNELISSKYTVGLCLITAFFSICKVFIDKPVKENGVTKIDMVS